MRTVMISNFYNPHLAAFSMEMASRGSYLFVETEEMTAERREIGWGKDAQPDFVKAPHGDSDYQEEIDRADVVIGITGVDKRLEKRLKAGKLTFKYAERFYRNSSPDARPVRNRLAAWLHHGRFQKYPLYMLCASAYTAADAAWSGNYLGRCYKWGYFPETREYAWETLAEKKRTGPVSILWVGRLVELKHPEAAVLTAERLKRDGYDFEMTIIGSGVLEEQLRQMVKERGLQDRVRLTGAMKPEQVRQHMERADVFLFTSDRNEGWGAVLNEAMNSGCAVVASHAIGAVPFLMRHGENGLIFRSEDWDDLYEKVKTLVDDPALRERYGRAAYETIAGEWNAAEAARRFLRLAEALKAGEDTPFAHGPCSRAEILKDDWM